MRTKSMTKKFFGPNFSWAIVQGFFRPSIFFLQNYSPDFDQIFFTSAESWQVLPKKFSSKNSNSKWVKKNPKISKTGFFKVFGKGSRFRNPLLMEIKSCNITYLMQNCPNIPKKPTPFLYLLQFFFNEYFSILTNFREFSKKF